MLAGNAKLFLSLALNVVSSVGVIFINKRLVFLSAGYHFGTMLTIIHFILTFLGCVMFAKLHFFEVKALNLWKVLPISLAFCGYVVFNNLSLLTNSVSVYQTSKILCTPVIVAVEYAVYHKRETGETLLALLPVCLGVFITVFSDNELNWIGSLWATLAIVSNSFYTIWGKTKQSELNVTPMQILTYQAPLSAAVLLFALPIDGISELVSFQYTSFSVFAIGLSCVFAFGVNFSFFLFVGQTSPLTMNVVGYLKTCLVFIGGFVFFQSALTVQNFIGIAMTMIGLALYMKAKSRPVIRQPESKEEV
jgi:solute carrier family 35, member E3